jgi:hypothetical protein
MQIQPTGATAVSSTNPSTNPSNADVIQDVATKLGMSADDIRVALQQGKSLSDLATQQGVSLSDLKDAIAQGVQQSSPGTTPAQAQKVADRIASGSGKRHHHHHQASAPTSATTTSTASLVPGQLPVGTQLDINA